MKRYSDGQIKIITDFLTTIAAGWFGAGVITTVFVGSVLSFDSIKNLIIGISLALTTLQYALYLNRQK